MKKEINRFKLSLWFLIISNLAVIIISIIENWDLVTILLIYWFQTAIIGVFHIFRLKLFKNFRNGKPNFVSMLIFLLFFGGFLFVFIRIIVAYSVSVNRSFSSNIVISLIPAIMIFLINHTISFVVNFKEDDKVKKDTGTFIFLPIYRTLPFNLIIPIFMVVRGSLFATLFFMIAKSVIDILMHIQEHKLLQGK